MQNVSLVVNNSLLPCATPASAIAAANSGYCSYHSGYCSRYTLAV